MTRPEYLAALATLGWTSSHLARVLGRSVHTVQNWARDRYSVPEDVAAWLARRVKTHERAMRDDPPPLAK